MLHGLALRNKVEFFVPSTVNVDTLADTTSTVDSVSSQFAQWFGGATVIDAYGTWLSDSLSLVREPIKIVYSNCTDEALAEHESDVESLALQVRQDLNQESVAVSVNNVLYLL